MIEKIVFFSAIFLSTRYRKNQINLKRLSLSRNLIEQIDSNGFQGLENLEGLDLSENKLIKIESNSIQHLKKLIMLME